MASNAKDAAMSGHRAIPRKHQKFVLNAKARTGIGLGRNNEK